MKWFILMGVKRLMIGLALLCALKAQAEPAPFSATHPPSPVRIAMSVSPAQIDNAAKQLLKLIRKVKSKK
jgi:hypothetical protein